jgi:hypothetical protein
MPLVTIIFDVSNDPTGHAKRHVGRQRARKISEENIILDAWQDRYSGVPNAMTSNTMSAPTGIPNDISYDSAIVNDAPQQDVLEALIKAGRR